MAVKTRFLGIGTLVALATLLMHEPPPRAAESAPARKAAITSVAKPGRGELIAKPESIAELIAQARIKADDVPTPHWTDDGCPACHLGKPTARNSALRNRDINRLCQACHDSISAHNYIHAVGMVPSPEKRNRMNQSLRQALQRGGNVITCISCHDLTAQCLPERHHERKDNPRFFRDGPYAERSQLCYSCHNPTHYERLNPHDQISDEGELNSQMCLVCHSVAPNRREVKSIADVSFNIDRNLTLLCAGCHPPIPHPAGSPGHLYKPSPETLEFINKTENQRGMILPLDPTNEHIFCATCHNPHERGVQILERADRGADGPRRLRAGGGPKDRICTVCHNL
ncbi:MAG: hypothetical protein M0Z99_04100 [Betaproteobacteria bacterium]|nr:hypothetical protein [Betaproteobacteria bacterium]